MVDISGIVVGALQSGQSIVCPAPASSATRWLPHDPHLKKMSGISEPLPVESMARWQPKKAESHPVPLLGLLPTDQDEAGGIAGGFAGDQIEPPQKCQASLTNWKRARPRPFGALDNLTASWRNLPSR